MEKEYVPTRTTERSPEERHVLMNRLNRVEGQIRGIKRMLNADAYCTDLLVQISAVNAALNSFGRELLAAHMKGCVVEKIKAGDTEVVDELVEVMHKMSKKG